MLAELEAALRSDFKEELERPSWQALRVLGGQVAAANGRETGSIVELTVGLMQRIAKVSPVLVIVDDLHWADESSRLFFDALSRGLKHSPSLLIGAYRDNEVGRTHPLQSVLAAIHRHAAPEVIELAPMNIAAAREIARRVSGVEPKEFEAIYERSGGNAFLLEELLAAPPGTLPPGAKAVVLARLGALSSEAGELATLASLDAKFQRHVLESASQAGYSAFVEAFDELTDSGLIGRHGDSFCFRHALIREVIYDSIPPGRVPDLRAQVAVALESKAAEDVGAIARHWRHSENPERALVTAVAAARHAVAIGAIPEGADWYDTAARLWPAAGDPELLTGRSLAHLVLMADEVFGECRRFGRSLELIESVLRDTSELSSADRAELLMALSLRCYQVSGDNLRTLPRAFVALRDAVAALDSGVPAVARLRVLCRFAIQAMIRYGLDDEAADALRQAYTLDPAAQAHWEVLVASANACVQASRGEDTIEFIDPLKSRSAFLFLQGENMRLQLSQLLALHSRTSERAVAGIALAAQLGLAAGVGFHMEATLARSLSAMGDWRTALTRFELMKATIGLAPLDEWQTIVVYGWGTLLVRSGRSAEPWMEQASEFIVPCRMDQFLGCHVLIRVELARAARDVTASRLAVSETLDIVRGHHMARCGEGVAFAIGMEADCAFDQGKSGAHALVLADNWVARLRSCLVAAPGRARIDDLGMFIEQSLAERARLAGEENAATWEDLAGRWHDLPRPYHEAYARYRAAFALLMAPTAATRKESRERAAAHLRTALGICQELGAVFLEADVLWLRQTAGLRARATTSPTVSLLSDHFSSVSRSPALTPRELEVLRLLVVGDSNGQIAVHLGISVKTASAHVSNIIHKLDAENRVEAAVRATRRGLVTAAARDR